jgi:hypothetical protein
MGPLISFFHSCSSIKVLYTFIRGREADRSPPSSAEVKNAWSYTSTPQYVFMAWSLAKYSDNFNFKFIHFFCLPKNWNDLRYVKMIKSSRNFCRMLNKWTYIIIKWKIWQFPQLPIPYDPNGKT